MRCSPRLYKRFSHQNRIPDFPEWPCGRSGKSGKPAIQISGLSGVLVRVLRKVRNTARRSSGPCKWSPQSNYGAFDTPLRCSPRLYMRLSHPKITFRTFRSGLADDSESPESLEFSFPDFPGWSGKSGILPGEARHLENGAQNRTMALLTLL